jgi:hypothetical protein
LVDPEPVDGMGNDPDTAGNVRGAVNDIVLKQRAAFLRPNSVLAIVMLTDENDCSVADEDGAQGWLVGYKGGVNGPSPWHMPYSTSACATDPSSQCCVPCGTSIVPLGCPAPSEDEACLQGAYRTVTDDSMNLRCFRQKERFGIDFLYPVDRYISALTRPTIRPRFGGPAIPNPLFAPGPDGTPGRRGDQVVLAGIVGVPWQDVVTEESWSPSAPGLTFLNGAELFAQGRWDAILGTSETGGRIDPVMIESIEPRPTGSTNPYIPSIAIAGPDETENVNPINGHEQAVTPTRDDLQFACIYPLAQPIPCNDENAASCECNRDEAPKNSPLCKGATSTEDGTQVYGRAYPSLRELEVLKGVGANSVVTSACPKNPASDDPSDANAGYVPALNALADQLVSKFADPCLPRALPISQCVLLEARPSDGDDCEVAGRMDPEGYGVEVAQTVEQEMGTQGYDTEAFTFCQIRALEGDDLDACENTAGGGSGAGYCYLDVDQGMGDPALLASCPASMKHRIRFVGDELPASGALTFVACFDGR